MKRITMKCPGTCGKTYAVTISDEQFETQSWKCPNCGYTAPFKVIHQWKNPMPIPPEPPIPPVGEDNGDAAPRTKRYDPNANKTQVAHQMVWQVAGGGARITIPLRPGRYIVGRKSSDSPANIKVAPDIYMSREHAILIVEPQGTKMTAKIAPKKPKNALYVNKRMLNINECVTLNTGDIIVMGNTTVQVTI